MADKLELGEILYAKGEHTEALGFGRMAYGVFKKQGEEGKKNCERSLELLINISKATQNPVRAAAYFSMLHKLQQAVPLPNLGHASSSDISCTLSTEEEQSAIQLLRENGFGFGAKSFDKDHALLWAAYRGYEAAVGCCSRRGLTSILLVGVGRRCRRLRKAVTSRSWSSCSPRRLTSMLLVILRGFLLVTRRCRRLRKAVTSRSWSGCSPQRLTSMLLLLLMVMVGRRCRRLREAVTSRSWSGYSPRRLTLMLHLLIVFLV